MGITRRQCVGAALGAAAALAAVTREARAAPERPTLQVWKNPACGCCGDWINHVTASGFAVRVHEVGDTAQVRARLGMPPRYGSCHTALVDGYAIEGHVPASEIHRLLRERPAALGLAAPGMPVGSPGMDGPAYGGRRDAYDVLLVRRDGSAATYRSFR